MEEKEQRRRTQHLPKRRGLLLRRQFLVAESFVLRTNICGTKPALRVAENRR